MKILLVILCTLVSNFMYAPNFTLKNTPNLMSQLDREEQILDNLIPLKDNSVRTRKETFNLVQPVIEVYLKRKNLQSLFVMEDSVSYALACIFVSESSNAKGQSAKSSLWMLHSNPFGLTSNEGVTKTSWEMVNNQRKTMKRTFRTFNNFEEAIDALIFDYLAKPRYDRVVQSKSVKEFLNNLYKCGYMTDNYWPTFAYKDIYLKSV